MKQKMNYLLPASAAVMGAVGGALHRHMLSTCLDESGLPMPGSPVWIPVVFTVLALFAVTALLLSTKLSATEDCSKVFQAEALKNTLLMVGTIGYLLTGVLYIRSLSTVTAQSITAGERMIPVVILVGLFGSALGMGLAAALGRLLPLFLLLPGFCGCFAMVDFYHYNAADPIILHFAWGILALAAAAMAWYHASGFLLNKGKILPTLFFSLIAVTLSLIALGGDNLLYVNAFLLTQAACFAVLSFQMLGALTAKA